MREYFFRFSTYVDRVVYKYIFPYRYPNYIVTSTPFQPYSGISKAEALVILSKLDYKLLGNPFNLKPLKDKNIVKKSQIRRNPG